MYEIMVVTETVVTIWYRTPTMRSEEEGDVTFFIVLP
jgi:hypothetical protein